MQSLQNRILGAWPSLRARTPAELLRGLKNKFLKASNGGLLRRGIGLDVIEKWVKLDPPGVSVIAGGVKDFRRAPENAYLVRDDGAWLHFTILVREGSASLEMLGYDFELVFPEEMALPKGGMPPFFRIDLNLPGHENEEREMRSHLHPGHDDLQAHAPVMSPDEILDLLIWGMRPRRADKTRA
jgi:hypothetical protein